MNPKKSKYDVIWEAVKKDRASQHPVGVDVSALPKLHARIIKAVTKRKLLDLSYKFEQAEAGKKKAKLVITVKGVVINFKLVYDKLLEGL